MAFIIHKYTLIKKENNCILEWFCRDYLTGFRKRKDERKKKAQDQVQKMIKEDRKLLKEKVRWIITYLYII